MPNVYSRTTKIHDAVGRSMYISGATGKQEEVVLHGRSMQHDWPFFAEYEKSHVHNPGQKQNEAREIVVALPNDLASTERNGTSTEQKETLSEICEDLALAIVGPNHDFEYCVHWNHDRTNLHVHMMFSERENTEARPMTYKKDIWKDPETGRLAKAGSEGAILLHHKGDLQYDADGHIKYNIDPLTAKDRKFKNHSFMAIRDRQIQRVLHEYGYDLDIQDKSTPYLSQRKLYKYARDDYKKAASDYNAAVREYNAAVKEHLSIDPDQMDYYKEVRADVEAEVKTANHAEQKISQRAIDAVKEMAEKVEQFVRDAYKRIASDVSAWWDASKDRILAAFRNQLSTSGESEVKHGNSEKSAGTAYAGQPAKFEDLRVSGTDIATTTQFTAEGLATFRSNHTDGDSEEKYFGHLNSAVTDQVASTPTQRIRY